MFSFHKPKVYRSTQGCCICKAKSSSSRFTDSKKYEIDFIECFQLASPRKGEICNACVLLVKRFKRLPPGSDRHWGHVVDARVGPGLKSMTKFKKRKEEQLLQQMIVNDGTPIILPTPIATSAISRSLSSVPEKFCKIFKKNKKKKLLECEAIASVDKNCLLQNLVEMDDDRESSVFPVATTSPNHCSSINDLLCDEMLDSPSSPLSQNNSDDNEHHDINIYHTNDRERVIMKNNEMNRNFIEEILNVHENSQHSYQNQNRRHICKRKIRIPVRNFGSRIVKENFASFIDTNYWKKVKTCCGYVYESNITNAIIIDCNLYKKCLLHKHMTNTSVITIPTNNSKLQLNNEKENFGSTTALKKIADNVNMPVTAIKKHHLYSKRQNLINNNVNNNSIICNNKTEVTLLQPPIIIPPVHGIGGNVTNNSVAANKYLHKIKSDSKIIKAGDIKPAAITTAKLKVADYNLVKNLMKVCTDKAVKHKNLDNTKLVNGDGVIITPDVLGNKFSDNSSDSGYEETPLEHVINQMPPLKKPIQGVRSVVLANGIKVHVQPQNLERAVNWAGVPQTAVASLQQTENIHFNSSTQSNIIVVQQKPAIDIILPNQSASNNQMIIDTMGTANITSNNNSATNLSQNIVIIKPKYLQQNC